MEFSKEEKDRICQRQKNQLEAKQKAMAEITPKKKTGCAGCLSFIGIIIIISVIIHIFSGNAQTADLDKVALLEPGKQAIVDNGDKVVILGAEKVDYNKIIKEINAKDIIGFAQMVLQGRVLIVKRKTKVIIIDNEIAIIRIRVLEGEKVGQSGWLAYEFVKPVQ